MKQTTLDIVKVIGANTASVGITIASVNELLTTVSILLAITYTAIKIHSETKKRK